MKHNRRKTRKNRQSKKRIIKGGLIPTPSRTLKDLIHENDMTLYEKYENMFNNNLDKIKMNDIKYYQNRYMAFKEENPSINNWRNAKENQLVINCRDSRFNKIKLKLKNIYEVYRGEYGRQTPLVVVEGDLEPEELIYDYDEMYNLYVVKPEEREEKCYDNNLDFISLDDFGQDETVIKLQENPEDENKKSKCVSLKGISLLIKDKHLPKHPINRTEYTPQYIDFVNKLLEKNNVGGKRNYTKKQKTKKQNTNK